MGDKSKEEDDYDPYVERKLPKGTTDLESMMHIIKGILGTGILAMPEAFKNSGIILGFVGSIGNGLLCTYATHVFVNCLYMLCKRNRVPVLTYAQAMKAGFKDGPDWARRRHELACKLADSFIILYQIGACCVYTLFVVLNIKSVLDVYLRDNLSVHFCLLLVTIPLLLINSLRNYKILVPFSLFANVITFFVIGCVFYYIFETPLPHFSERPLFQGMQRFPLAFGTTCFAFTAVGVVFAVENNMKTPKHFGGWFGIYNRSLVILMTVYVSLAFLGYWKFGEETKSSIALNLPPEAWLTQTANLLYALAIYISFGLNGLVPINLFWNSFLAKRLTDCTCVITWEYLVRIALVSICLVFAATVPMLGLFVSLLGSIALSHLLFIFPGFLDLCTRYPNNYGCGKIYKYRSIFLICYGFIGLITGVSVGFYEIAIEFNRMYG